MAKRRIGVARFWHESNSFSSALTEIEDFESYQGGTLVGRAVPEAVARRDEIAGFIDVLRGRNDIEIVPLISAGALPSGLISRAAAAHLETLWRDELVAAGPLEGVCIATHGAMAADDTDDFDGHLLAILRDRLGAEAPLVTALDCHAVVTQKMVDASTALVAFRTHPHVDVLETGKRAASILLDALDGRTRPTVRMARLPMLVSPPDDGTHAGVMKELFEAFSSWDA